MRKTCPISLCLLVLILAMSGCLEARTKPADHALVSDARFEAGMEAFRRSDLDLAGKKLEAYVKSDPSAANVAEAVLTLGKIALYERRYDDAIASFGRVTEGFPSSPYSPEARHLSTVASAEKRRMMQQASAASSGSSPVGDTPTESPALSNLAVGPQGEAFLTLVAAWREADDAGRIALSDDLKEQVDRMGEVELLQVLHETAGADEPFGVILYRLGALNRHQGEIDRAVRHFDRLRKEFPEHSLAKRAASALAQIESCRKVDAKKIGVMLPLSGRFKVLGERLQQAVELAGTEMKARLGGNVELIVRDTQGDPKTAVAVFDRLVLEENVIAVIGPVLGDTAQTVAYRAQHYGVPLVTLSPRKGLPEIGDQVFRVAMTAEMQAQTIVSYAWDTLELRRFAILYPRHNYGEDLAHAFWDEVKKRNGIIAGVENYVYDATTFKRPVRSMVGRYNLVYANPDGGVCRDTSGARCGLVRSKYDDEAWPIVDFEALFIPDYARQAGMIAPSLPFEEVEIDTKRTYDYRRVTRKRRRTGKDVPMVQLLGGNGWNNPRLKEFGGKWVEGSIFCDGFFAGDVDNPRVYTFVDAFKKAYKRQPGSIDAYAYDAVGFVEQALASRKPTERRGFRDALIAIQDFKGVTGAQSFASDGELLGRLILLTLHEEEIVPAVVYETNAAETLDNAAPQSQKLPSEG